MIKAEELLKKASPSAKRRYKKNRKIHIPSDSINGQMKCCASKFRLGLFPMSYNGCGAIAVYNALYYLGQSPVLADIALGIEMYALRFWGLLGTDPEKIEKMFKECRIAAIKANDYDDFVKVMSAVKAGIVCYWVNKPKRSSLHFAAIINDNEGKYLVCNRYSNRTKPSVIQSVEKLCSKEQYVAGFFMN